jgi:hypothetical protein
MEEDLPLTAKSKDKFMIQSVTITPEKKSLTLSEIVSTQFSSVSRRLLISRKLLGFPSLAGVTFLFVSSHSGRALTVKLTRKR